MKLYCDTCETDTTFNGPYCSVCDRWNQDSFDRVVVPKLKKIRQQFIKQVSGELLALEFRGSCVKKVSKYIKEYTLSDGELETFAEELSN